MRNGLVEERGHTAEIFKNPQTPYTKALIAASLNLKATEGIVKQ